MIEAASCLGILDDCQLQSAVEERLGVDPLYQIPDALWERIGLLIPPHEKKTKRGRPRMDDRKAMNGIFYVLRTGCQWKALPRSLGEEEHGPRQVPGVEEGGRLRGHVEGEPPRVRRDERDRLGVAVDGRSDNEGPSRGKKHGAEPHR